MLVRRCTTSTEFACLLEMFFSQISHPKILKTPSEHPMVKRIVGSELIGLFFVEHRLRQACLTRAPRQQARYWPTPDGHCAARHRSKPKRLLPCCRVARAIRLFPGARESSRLFPPALHRDLLVLRRNAPDDSGSRRDSKDSKLCSRLSGKLRPCASVCTDCSASPNRYSNQASFGSASLFTNNPVLEAAR